MRAYNPKISEKANISLNNREKKVSTQKHFILVFSILAVSIAILLCTTMITFAKTNNSASPVKEYESIQIQSGQTLWNIAETNVDGFGLSEQEYIDEVEELNSIDSDHIHSGQYIIIPVYHYE